MFNQYQPNIENMQQYLNQENEKSYGDGPNWWSIPSGMSSVRILPPWDPTGRVALPVFMHPIEFQGQNMKYKKWNWTCTNKTFNKPCQICDGLASIAAAGVDISNWEANRRQYYFNAIVMHDPTYNAEKKTGTAPGTLVVMKAGKTVYDWVISQITNPMIGDITNVQNGIDVFITKEGQGLGTEYKLTLSPNGRTAIPQEYLDRITDLYNLDDIFSGGFDQAQIDEMVGHLKKSAGVMSNSISNTVNQMAGYSQVPQNSQMPQQMQNPGVFPQGGLNYNQSSNPTPPEGLPWSNPNPVPSPAPTPFNAAPSQPIMNPPQAPVAPVTPQAQTPQSTNANPSSGANLPKCFGQYDPGNVNCVVCPCEVDCSRSKGM